MNKPLFSIITVCFNSERTIKRTIESVLRQGFTDYEYLIIDGLSTDRTLEIANQYLPLFKGRMSIFSESDSGIYDAFNKGILRSNGVYCWLVNSDDYISENALQIIANVYNSIKSVNTPILVGDMQFVTSSGELIGVSKFDSFHLKNGFTNDYIGVPHPSTLVPRDVYDTYGLYDTYYKIIGDADWFHRVYAANVTFLPINAVVTNMTDGGVSNQFSYIKSLRDRLHYLSKFYKNPFLWMYHFIVWNISFYLQKYSRLR